MIARVLLLALGIPMSALCGTEVTLLRIGTGGQEGTYFPIGSLIARALSGTEKCAGDENCGVPGLLAVAEISNGSVSNVDALSEGALEACLSQADVAYWAYNGSQMFADRGRRADLRAIARLYPESVHLVSRRGSGVVSVANLAGRRVSLDEPGSGTLVDARMVLAAFGVSESSLRPVYLKPQFAAEKLIKDQLDAFFFVGGYPAGAIASLASTHGARLVPIDGAPAQLLIRENPFLTPGTIPGGTYAGIPETPTLNVPAYLLVSARLPDELVYRITRALWSARAHRILARGHPKGRLIRRDRALLGLSIPLHPGAARYYREVGLLPPAPATEPAR